ncbi:uncharacterized protein LOC133717012 [Rosa rugosa]|uniref:uncharacterized protein LOC133717012 n=1 Tax=Rosa rugosa TaxID=74645 RepID=UPI002B40B38E|nr:uncharacterized protein LOC133717012 [Rosa rugosa]
MRISHCDTAKQAWDLLQVTYEGNKKVRGQKLQRLVLEFENMTMGEDESIDDFHARLLNVTNQCCSLDDPFEEHRIVKKFLRALPSKFQAKYNLRGNKALKSTWSDSDEGSQSDGEEVNLALTSSLNIDVSDNSDLEDDTLDEETNVKCKQLYHASKIVLRKNYTLEKEVDSLREEKEKIELQFETSLKEWNVERTNLVDKIKVLQDEVKSKVGDKEHG